VAVHRWVVALAVLGGAGANAATVWVAPSAVKVRPQMQPSASSPAAAVIAGAKNEFESFQVVVTGAAAGVSMSFESLTGPGGRAISGRDLTLYREALITLTQKTGGDGATGVWPDALIPAVDPIVGEKRNAFPFDVPAGESRAVFVDVHVPADAPAGTYTGNVIVSGGVSAQVPVTLTVWDFGMPSTATLRSAYGMNWNGPCMGHGDSNCTNTAYEKPLRQRYLQAALDNRISIDIPTLSSPISSSGSGSWTDYDTYAGPFLDGTANTRLQGAKLTAVQIDGDISSASVIKAWSDHFAIKGWTGALFDYTCDEPPATCTWTQLTSRLNTATSASPSLPRLVTTSWQDASAHALTGSISLFTPVLDQMENRPGTAYAGNQRALYPAYIWWYQSCDSFGCSGSDAVGWPTMAIDSDATRGRAMEWLSFSYDVSGELYYETTMAYFTGDPWVNQRNFGGNGDGNLFYPGTAAKIGGQTEIPVESLRMKLIRDGMEDYELLHMAKQLGLESTAKQISRGLFPVTYQATTTPAALESARAQLAAMILHSLGKDVTPDAGTPDAGSDAGVIVVAPDGGGVAAGDAGADAGAVASNDDAGAPDGGVVVSLSDNSGVTTSTLGGGCAAAGAPVAWAAPLLLALLVRRRRR
jgi:uncharacterized protein (TIGR03382 family)